MAGIFKQNQASPFGTPFHISSEFGARIQPQGGLLINFDWKGEAHFLLQKSWDFVFSLCMMLLCISTSVAIELQQQQSAWATDLANRQTSNNELCKQRESKFQCSRTVLARQTCCSVFLCKLWQKHSTTAEYKNDAQKFRAWSGWVKLWISLRCSKQAAVC